MKVTNLFVLLALLGVTEAGKKKKVEENINLYD